MAYLEDIKKTEYERGLNEAWKLAEQAYRDYGNTNNHRSR